MPETEEEKKKRWAAAAAKNAYMTPAMMHAINMSKQQSQKRYKEDFNKTKGKGYTCVSTTPELENAKKQSALVSTKKYKSEFERNKAKFTQVAEDPEILRIRRVSNQISDNAYKGKVESSTYRSKRRREPAYTKNVAEKSPAKIDEADPKSESAHDQDSGVSSSVGQQQNPETEVGVTETRDDAAQLHESEQMMANREETGHEASEQPLKPEDSCSQSGEELVADENGGKYDQQDENGNMETDDIYDHQESEPQILQETSINEDPVQYSMDQEDHGGGTGGQDFPNDDSNGHSQLQLSSESQETGDDNPAGQDSLDDFYANLE